jgi:hypothetical protein
LCKERFTVKHFLRRFAASPTVRPLSRGSSVPSRFGQTPEELVFVAVLFVSSASFVAMSVGDPELMALVAATGIVVVLLGTLIVRDGVRHDREQSRAVTSR